jgi:hypothetical protein
METWLSEGERRISYDAAYLELAVRLGVHAGNRHRPRSSRNFCTAF